MLPFKRYGEPIFEVDTFDPENQKGFFYVTITAGLDVYGPKPEEGTLSEKEEILISQLAVRYQIVVQKTSDIPESDFDVILNIQIPYDFVIHIQFFVANLLLHSDYGRYFIASPDFNKLYEEKSEKEANGKSR